MKRYVSIIFSLIVTATFFFSYVSAQNKLSDTSKKQSASKISRLRVNNQPLILQNSVFVNKEEKDVDIALFPNDAMAGTVARPEYMAITPQSVLPAARCNLAKTYLACEDEDAENLLEIYGDQI